MALVSWTVLVETDFLIHIIIFNLVWHRLFICRLKLHWLQDACGSSGPPPIPALHCLSRAFEPSRLCLSCFLLFFDLLDFPYHPPPNGQEEANNFY